MRKKAGHLGGWGFVLLLEGQVLYDFGVIRPEHLKALRRDSGTSAPGDYLRPPPSSPLAAWPLSGQFALMKGYGRDPAVNGTLAAFRGLAAACHEAPELLLDLATW